MSFSTAELRTIATLENKKFKAGIAEIEQSVNKLGAGKLKEIGSMIGGAFAVGAIVSFGKALMEQAAQTDRYAKTLGISVGLLDELGDVAQRTGADGQGFQQKLAKLVETQDKAATGDKELVKAFNGLGVSMDEVTSLTPDQLLLKVAEGAQKDATAIHDLNQVMGKGAAGEYGAALRDIANNGLPAVDKAVEESIQQFSKLNRQYQILKDKIGEGFMKGAVAVGKFFMPSIEESAVNQKRTDDDNRRSQNKARLEGLRLEHEAALDAVILKGKEKVTDIEKRRDKALDNITVGAPRASDSMAAYGRMIGGSMAGSNGVAERQLKEMEIIAKAAEDIQKATEETATAIKDLGGD